MTQSNTTEINGDPYLGGTPLERQTHLVQLTLGERTPHDGQFIVDANAFRTRARRRFHDVMIDGSRSWRAMDCPIPSIRSTFKGLTDLATLASVSDSVPTQTVDLNFHFSQTKFLDANMTSPLGAILAHIEQKHGARVYIDIDSIPDQLFYLLRRNRFLLQYGVPALDDHFETTIPYKKFHISDERRFQSYIFGRLNRERLRRFRVESRPILQRTVFEVYQNAVQHSNSGLGVFVCGQYFPRKGRLLFSISDAGIGIRDSVRNYVRKKWTSIAALRWALKSSNTTKTGSQPGGLGLDELKDAVHQNGGAIMIASRLAYYEYRNGREEFEELGADFPGTSVTIEIKTDEILEEDGDIPF